MSDQNKKSVVRKGQVFNIPREITDDQIDDYFRRKFGDSSRSWGYAGASEGQDAPPSMTAAPSAGPVAGGAGGLPSNFSMPSSPFAPPGVSDDDGNLISVHQKIYDLQRKQFEQMAEESGSEFSLLDIFKNAMRGRRELDSGGGYAAGGSATDIFREQAARFTPENWQRTYGGRPLTEADRKQMRLDIQGYYGQRQSLIPGVVGATSVGRGLVNYGGNVLGNITGGLLDLGDFQTNISEYMQSGQSADVEAARRAGASIDKFLPTRGEVFRSGVGEGVGAGIGMYGMGRALGAAGGLAGKLVGRAASPAQQLAAAQRAATGIGTAGRIARGAAITGLTAGLGAEPEMAPVTDENGEQVYDSNGEPVFEATRLSSMTGAAGRGAASGALGGLVAGFLNKVPASQRNIFKKMWSKDYVRLPVVGAAGNALSEPIVIAVADGRIATAEEVATAATLGLLFGFQDWRDKVAGEAKAKPGGPLSAFVDQLNTELSAKRDLRAKELAGIAEAEFGIPAAEAEAKIESKRDAGTGRLPEFDPDGDAGDTLSALLDVDAESLVNLRAKREAERVKAAREAEAAKKGADEEAAKEKKKAEVEQRRVQALLDSGDFATEDEARTAIVEQDMAAAETDRIKSAADALGVTVAQYKKIRAERAKQRAAAPPGEAPVKTEEQKNEERFRLSLQLQEMGLDRTEIEDYLAKFETLGEKSPEPERPMPTPAEDTGILAEDTGATLENLQSFIDAGAKSPSRARDRLRALEASANRALSAYESDPTDANLDQWVAAQDRYDQYLEKVRSVESGKAAPETLMPPGAKPGATRPGFPAKPTTPPTTTPPPTEPPPEATGLGAKPKPPAPAPAPAAAEPAPKKPRAGKRRTEAEREIDRIEAEMQREATRDIPAVIDEADTGPGVPSAKPAPKVAPAKKKAPPPAAKGPQFKADRNVLAANKASIRAGRSPFARSIADFPGAPTPKQASELGAESLESGKNSVLDEGAGIGRSSAPMVFGRPAASIAIDLISGNATGVNPDRPARVMNNAYIARMMRAEFADGPGGTPNPEAVIAENSIRRLNIPGFDESDIKNLARGFGSAADYREIADANRTEIRAALRLAIKYAGGKSGRDLRAALRGRLDSNIDNSIEAGFGLGDDRRQRMVNSIIGSVGGLLDGSGPSNSREALPDAIRELGMKRILNRASPGRNKIINDYADEIVAVYKKTEGEVIANGGDPATAKDIADRAVQNFINVKRIEAVKSGKYRGTNVELASILRMEKQVEKTGAEINALISKPRMPATPSEALGGEIRGGDVGAMGTSREAEALRQRARMAESVAEERRRLALEAEAARPTPSEAKEAEVSRAPKRGMIPGTTINPEGQLDPDLFARDVRPSDAVARAMLGRAVASPESLAAVLEQASVGAGFRGQGESVVRAAPNKLIYDLAQAFRDGPEAVQKLINDGRARDGARFDQLLDTALRMADREAEGLSGERIGVTGSPRGLSSPGNVVRRIEVEQPAAPSEERAAMGFDDISTSSGNARQRLSPAAVNRLIKAEPGTVVFAEQYGDAWGEQVRIDAESVGYSAEDAREIARYERIRAIYDNLPDPDSVKGFDQRARLRSVRARYEKMMFDRREADPELNDWDIKSEEMYGGDSRKYTPSAEPGSRFVSDLPALTRENAPPAPPPEPKRGMGGQYSLPFRTSFARSNLRELLDEGVITEAFFKAIDEKILRRESGAPPVVYYPLYDAIKSASADPSSEHISRLISTGRELLGNQQMMFGVGGIGRSRAQTRVPIRNPRPERPPVVYKEGDRSETPMAKEVREERAAFIAAERAKASADRIYRDSVSSAEEKHAEAVRDINSELIIPMRDKLGLVGKLESGEITKAQYDKEMRAIRNSAEVRKKMREANQDLANAKRRAANARAKATGGSGIGRRGTTLSAFGAGELQNLYEAAVRGSGRLWELTKEFAVKAGVEARALFNRLREAKSPAEVKTILDDAAKSATPAAVSTAAGEAVGETMSLAGRIKNVGGAAGERLSRMFRETADRSRQYEGEMSPEFRELVEASGGFFAQGVSFGPLNSPERAAARSLEKIVPVPGTNYGESIFKQAIEGRYEGTLTPEQKRIVNAAVRLGAKTLDLAKKVGMLRLNRETGKLEGYENVPAGREGMVFRHMPTEKMVEIIGTGEAHSMWPALVKAVHAKNPGKTIDEVGTALKERSESMRLGGLSPGEKTSALEFFREFDMPTGVLDKSGKMVPLFETNPAEWGRAMRDSTSTRLGFVKVFGQDFAYDPETMEILQGEPSRIDIERNKYRAAAGENADLAVKYFDTARLAAEGRAVEPRTSEQTTVVRAAKWINSNIIQGPVKAAKLSASGLYNVLEPFGMSAEQAGYGNVMQAYGEALLSGLYNLTNGKFGSKDSAEIFRRLERMGAVGAERVSSQRFVTGVAARSMEIAVGKMKARKGNPMANGADSDSAKLLQMGYDQKTANRLARGDGTAAEYDALVRKAAPSATGGRMGGVEKTRWEHSTGWRDWFPIASYATRQFGQLARTVKMAFDAPTMTPGLAKSTAEQIFKTAGGRAASGTASVLLFSMFMGGRAALEAAWNELKEDPVGTVMTGAASSIISGPFAGLSQAMMKEDRTIFQALFPLAVAKETADFVTGEGRYTDRSAGDRAVEFTKWGIPALKAVESFWQTGAYILGADTIAYDTKQAKRAYYKWVRENKIRRTTGGVVNPTEDDERYSSAMRKAKRAIENREGADAVLLHLREAFGVREGAKRGAGGKSLSASIEQARLLSELTDQQKASLRRTIGSDNYNLIEAQDKILDAIATSLASGKRGDKTTGFPEARLRRAVGIGRGG